MVATRIVIAVGFAFVYLSIGAGWLHVTSGITAHSYNVLDLAGSVGPYVSSGYLPSNSSIDGEIWVLLAPALVSQSPLVVAEWAFPVSLVLSVAAFFRWKLMLFAGISGVLSGSSWVWGIGLIRGGVVSQLNSWYGYGGRVVSSSIDPQIGAYIAVVGGIVFIVGYFLSRAEKLGTPLD